MQRPVAGERRPHDQTASTSRNTGNRERLDGAGVTAFPERSIVTAAGPLINGQGHRIRAQPRPAAVLRSPCEFCVRSKTRLGPITRGSGRVRLAVDYPFARPGSPGASARDLGGRRAQPGGHVQLGPVRGQRPAHSRPGRFRRLLAGAGGRVRLVTGRQPRHRTPPRRQSRSRRAGVTGLRAAAPTSACSSPAAQSRSSPPGGSARHARSGSRAWSSRSAAGSCTVSGAAWPIGTAARCGPARPTHVLSTRRITHIW